MVSSVAQQSSVHLTVSNNIALHCKSTRGNRRDLALPVIPPLTSQGRRRLTCDRKSAWREWRERSHWEGDFIDHFLTRAEAIILRRGISFALASPNRLGNCEGHLGLCGWYKITCSEQQSGITKRVKISDYIGVQFSSFRSVSGQIMDLPGLPPCYDSTRNRWGCGGWRYCATWSIEMLRDPMIQNFMTWWVFLLDCYCIWLTPDKGHQESRGVQRFLLLVVPLVSICL